jgi:magnesium chelatase family protein
MRTRAGALDSPLIHSVAGLTAARIAWVMARPCRAPHQTISDAGLIGGGRVPMSGKVLLAHHGVLFLDELHEFHRPSKVLRRPLENGVTSIHSPARP